MSRVFISGLGQISAAGQGLQALIKARDLGLVNTQSLKVLNKQGEKEIQIYQTPEVELPDTLPESVKRRMARFSKMCFASVSEALADYEIRSNRKIENERTGIVMGSAFCSFELANLFEKKVQLEGPTGASPTLFAGSVQNSVVSQLSISFGLRGPASTVVTLEETTFAAFRTAYDWLRAEVVDHVVVVIGDELAEHLNYAMASLPAVAALQPESNACTSIIGEGVVCLVLSRGLTKGSYAEVTRVSLGEAECKIMGDLYVSAFGREGQWAKYQSFVGSKTSLKCHSKIYGSMITGSGFEVALAAFDQSKKSSPSVCLQLTDHDEVCFLEVN